MWQRHSHPIFTAGLAPTLERGSIVAMPKTRRELRPRRRAYQLKRTSPDPGSAGMYSYGPASIWISGPIGGTWYATVRFRSQEQDLDARSLQGVLDESMRWVDEAPKPSAKQLQQEINEVLDR